MENFKLSKTVELFLYELLHFDIFGKKKKKEDIITSVTA